MATAAKLKSPATWREKIQALGELFLTPRALLIVYVVAAILATVSKLVAKDIVYNGVLAHRMIPFDVYRTAFYHLIHHQDLYANYATEPDIFKYSPAFALFMAPFALLPYWAGAILWNLLNALAIFAGVWAIPRVGDRAKAFILWFVILRVIENMQNAQSDALVAGLMMGAWAAMEHQKPLASAFSVMASVFVKLFGALALLPCLMVSHTPSLMISQTEAGAPNPWRSRWHHQLLEWRKLFGYLVMWTALLALAPALVAGPARLPFLYRSWYARLRVDAEANAGLSVASLLNWLHLPVPRLIVLAVGAAALLAVFLLRRDAYGDFRFRLLAISSVLIFAVIFNHMSESSSMIIALTGVAIWYFTTGPNPGSIGGSVRPGILDGLLAASVFVFTVLFATSIIPGALRSHVMGGNLLTFSAPCMLVWLKLQHDLLRFPAPDRVEPA